MLIFAHLATPRPRYTDRGKSAVVLPGELREGFRAADRGGDQAHGPSSGSLRSATAVSRSGVASASPHVARRTSIKDAVWQVLPDAYDGRVPAVRSRLWRVRSTTQHGPGSWR